MSDDIGAYALEPRWVRRSFDRAAKTYDAAAVLHTEVRENLLQRLQMTPLQPTVITDRRDRRSRPGEPCAEAPLPKSARDRAGLVAQDAARGQAAAVLAAPIWARVR